MRRPSLFVLLVLLMIFTAACGSGAGEPDRSNQPDNQIQVTEEDSAGTDEVEVLETKPLTLPPIDQVDQVAAVLYQGLLDGEDVTGLIEAIYEAVGIPVLDPETELDQIETAVENQSAFALESQMELIATALASGLTLNLESFIIDINRMGFYATDPRGDVTREYLSQNLSYLMDQSDFLAEENQFSLILALGRTRSSILYGEIMDPVWGDDQLDPLQSSLFWYQLDGLKVAPQTNSSGTIQRISYSSAKNKPQQGRGPLGPLLGLEGDIASELGLCNTVKIFGHKSSLELSENEIYRQIIGSDKPFQSDAKFTLEYTYQPKTQADKLALALIGCPADSLPPQGPRPDIPVTWEMISDAYPGSGTASLESMGVFTPGEATDEKGISQAIYLANLEVVPLYLQQDENEYVASGWIRATASDLFPGDQQILTVTTEYAGWQKTEGLYHSKADLRVGYYTFPTVEWHFEDERTGITIEGISFSCDGVNWVATHAYSHVFAGFSVTTSAEFGFTMPEIQLGDSVMSNPIEVVFTGVYDTEDGPIPVSDRREVWLEISQAEITMNFEPLGATVTIDGNTFPFPGTFVFRSIPANLLPNSSCD